MTQMWIKRQKDAKNLPLLLETASRHRMPQDVYAKIMQHKFRVVENTTDGRGGFFVVFDTPPRKKRWWSGR